ncbi:MAG: endolytic transglycosylase MltG [Pseudomonadota bacterium]
MMRFFTGAPWLALVLTGVLILLLAAMSVLADLLRFAHTPMRFSQSFCFEVERGARLGGLLHRLEYDLALGALESPRMLALARLSGVTARLRAGEYRAEVGQTPAQWLAMLAHGRGIPYRVTLIEGMTLEQVRDVLAHHPALRQDGFALSGDGLMLALGAPGKPAEGFFMPETYTFTRGASDIEILRQAHEAMRATLDRLWRERDPGLPLASPEQALVLASIVEKETGKAAERPRIAGVFINRLRKGMKLQTDPSVIYGLGPAFDGNLRRRDLETDTPWNTYTRSGLPPTPIALPSSDALSAVLHPEVTDALYFVADGSGGHAFSRTLDEHNQAVRRWIQRNRQ